MDHDLDKTKPPSTSYRETFRRHRKLFCIPPILGLIVAAFFLFGKPTSYNATANLWVDTAPPAPSSIAEGPYPQAPPAVAEQELLTELLATDSFISSVADSTLLRKSLDAGSSRNNAAALLGTGNIRATAVGNQVLQLGYTASSPAIATSVLAAVVAQLRNYTDRLAAQHDQAAIAYDNEQVKAAETALATARGHVNAYQAQHPGVGQADPTYAALVTAQENAATQLAQANTARGQAAAPSGWSIQAVDPPTKAGAAALSKKKMVEVIFGGALAGLLVSFLVVVALTPAKKEVWEDELPIGGPFAPNVAPADPVRAGSPTVPVAPVRAIEMPTAVGQGQPRLSLGDRRFQFRTPSAPTQDQ